MGLREPIVTTAREIVPGITLQDGLGRFQKPGTGLQVKEKGTLRTRDSGWQIMEEGDELLLSTAGAVHAPGAILGEPSGRKVNGEFNLI